jgi:phospholipase/carboxylesterase
LDNEYQHHIYVDTSITNIHLTKHNHMTNSVIKDPISKSYNTELPYLTREPLTASANKKAIILLHGVGSNEKDLFSLASQLPNEFYIISPRGPFILSVGRYAWYNVNFSTGKPVYNAEQEATSREIIRIFIQQIIDKYKLNEIYLGGFSQGAIMSYSIGLTNPSVVQGIIALSGRVLEEIKPLVKKDVDFQKLKVFVAHGEQDNTLSIHYAKQAKEYLENLGVQLSYYEYPIGHQISKELLHNLNDWLR